MNKLVFLSALQKPCAIPSRVQKNLREKIIKSDFLVADDKGTHRLIGLLMDAAKLYAEQQ